MNLDQTTAIRIAIRDTTGAIARQETPEPTRTALQAHLDALLKEELRALTGQAREVDLAAEFAESEQTRAKCAALRQDTPWYPDDSGEWVEGHPRDLPPETEVSGFMYLFERKNQKYTKPSGPRLARNLRTVDSIVAYKVVKPCE